MSPNAQRYSPSRICGSREELDGMHEVADVGEQVDVIDPRVEDELEPESGTPDPLCAGSAYVISTILSL